MTFPTPREALYGTPPSEFYEPRKGDLQQVLEQIETIAVGPIKDFHDSVSDLPDSGNTNGDIRIVLSTDADDRGVYRWTTSGTPRWVKRGPLPLILTESVSAAEAKAARDSAIAARNSAVAARDAARVAQNNAQDAAENADTARAGAVTAKDASISARNESRTARDQAKAHAVSSANASAASQLARGFSEAAKTQAELAAIAAAANVQEIKATVAEGLAETDDGEIFYVFDATSLVIYRNEDGSALRLGSLGDVSFTTSLDLLASTLTFEVGQYIRTLDGFHYITVLTGGDLITAGGRRLVVLGVGTPVSCRAFGARGDGVSDDTAALQKFFNWIRSGGMGFLTDGEYSANTLTCANGTHGFRLTGAGIGRAIIKHRSDTLGTQGIYISNTPRTYLSGFTVDNNESSAGDDSDDRGIAVSIKNSPHSTVENVEARNSGSVGIFMYGELAGGTHTEDEAEQIPDQSILNCRAISCNRGIQMVGVRDSRIIGSHAEDSTVSGIYVKCPSSGIVISDCTSDGATWGFAVGSSFGTDYEARRHVFSNLTARNTLTGFKAYNLVDSVIANVTLSMTGDNTDGYGDGLRLAASHRNRVDNLIVQNVAPLRAAVRFEDSDLNFISIGSVRNVGSGGLIAGTAGTTSSNSNTVVVEGYNNDDVVTEFIWNDASVGNRYHSLIDMRDRKRTYFGRDLFGYSEGIDAGAKYAFGFAPGNVAQYIALMASEEDSKNGFIWGDRSSNARAKFRYSIADSEFQWYIGSDLSLVVASAFLSPVSDNFKTLGNASARWSVVYSGTGAINTSDAREKVDLAEIGDEILDAWASVDFKRFRFADAVAAKGAAARTHIGLVAQEIQTAFTAADLDPFALGILCHDTWTDEETGEERDRYGVRYDEALALEAALMRRTTERLTQRLEALEASV